MLKKEKSSFHSKKLTKENSLSTSNNYSNSKEQLKKKRASKRNVKIEDDEVLNTTSLINQSSTVNLNDKANELNLEILNKEELKNNKKNNKNKLNNRKEIQLKSKQISDNNKIIINEKLLFEKSKNTRFTNIIIKQICLLLFVIIAIVICISKIVLCLKLDKKIKTIIDEFQILTLYYDIPAQFYCQLLVLFSLPTAEGKAYIGNMYVIRNTYEEKYNKMNSNHMENFPKLSKYLEIVNNPKDYTTICGEEKEEFAREICHKILKNNVYNLFQKDIQTGLNAINRQVYNTFYIYLENESSLKNISSLIIFFDKDFITVGLNVNFVFCIVHDKIFSLIYEDEVNTLDSHQNKIIILNYFILVCVCIFLYFSYLEYILLFIK